MPGLLECAYERVGPAHRFTSASDVISRVVFLTLDPIHTMVSEEEKARRLAFAILRFVNVRLTNNDETRFTARELVIEALKEAGLLNH